MPTWIPRTGAATAVAGLALAACGGGGSSTQSNNASAPLLIAVVAPTTADPYVAQVLQRGTDLAMREINGAGGVTVAGVKHKVQIKTYDDALDPQRTSSAVQSAIHDGAFAIVTDGYDAAASAGASDSANVPQVIVANGSTQVLDPKAHPSLFRIGIPNDAAASILGAYVAKTSKSPGIIHDDSDNGRDGADQLAQALPTAGAHPVANQEAALNAPTVDAQVRALVDAHADSIVVYGTDTFVARVITAVRAVAPSLPIFAGPSGESPLVRAQAGSAAEGVDFVDSRMTSEDDSSSFGQFEHRLAAAEGGPTDAGVKDAAGQEIRQPADLEIFPYDAVNLLAAAAQKLGSLQPSKDLLTLMTKVSVRSANGDTRGLDPDNHEGVSDDDLYIARIHDNQFEPVRDEQLSATLPAADEILADFH